MATVETRVPPEEALAPDEGAPPATGLALPVVSGLYTLAITRPIPRPRPFPQVPPRSASWRPPIPPPPERLEEAAAVDQDLDFGLHPVPFPLLRAELRLDVDGRYPQHAASGILQTGPAARTHWVARLRPTGTDTWAGPIWYRDGNTSLFPYTRVDMHVSRTARQATVRFSVNGFAPARTVVLECRSPYFHPLNLEFDCAQGTAAVTTVNTCAHPDRPATLPCETLSLETVFRRAGFDVSRSPGGLVPISVAGADARWTDQEMHDAMEAHWSRYSNRPQWAIWTFFASLSARGTGLGGIMFDYSQDPQRQGCAIFEDSFIKDAPAGDADPAAWVKRMRFWTAAHEMGHCVHLYHSWVKSADTPWIPLQDDPAALSFMNYPYYYPGDQDDFFRRFEYRFTDPELLFLRHAPSRFVQPGNADWSDHHGLQQSVEERRAPLRLELRVNREKPAFDFLEPVMVELKLENLSDQPVLVDRRLLERGDGLTVIIKREGRPARRFRPFATYCWKAEKATLRPGRALYESLFLSAGLNGWDLAEPGRYVIQAALEVGEATIVSNPLRLAVRPPQDVREEALAQDFFTEDVGRVLTFDGTRTLSKASDALQEVVERLPSRPVACHAALALGLALSRDSKELVPVEDGKRRFTLRVHRAQASGRALLHKALAAAAPAALETLGHVDYGDYATEVAQLLSQEGDHRGAGQIWSAATSAMSARRVNGRPILKEVLARFAALQQQGYRAEAVEEEPSEDASRRRGDGRGRKPAVQARGRKGGMRLK